MNIVDIERALIKRYRSKLYRPFVQAINKYDLIQEADKIAVCMSGGKDSFVLAKLFQELKRHGKIDFDVKYIVMNPGFNKINLDTLVKNAEAMNIPIIIKESNIFKVANEYGNGHPCYLCARMRRGHLYAKAKELGCNKIAYAHHMDDIIETFLLSLFYESRIHTFSPVTYLDRMELTLIRPFLYVSEGEIKGFAKESNLPVAKNPCPVDGYTKRQYVKDLLSNLKKDNNNIKKHIFRAILSGEISGFHL